MDNNSDDPPAISDVNGSISDGQEEKVDSKESPEKPSFAIPRAIREEQIQNAVMFLAHPKVRGSPVIYRRSFLEKKGLTREEIDEAFCRVPDPPSNAKSVEAAVNNQAGLSKSPSLELQNPTARSQPADDRTSIVDVVPTSRQWPHAFLALGMLAVSGYGTTILFKKICISWLKPWIRKAVKAGDESPEKDANVRASLAKSAAQSAKAASYAIALAKSHQELLTFRAGERIFYEALMEMMNDQLHEMKSMNSAIQNLNSINEKGPANSLKNSYKFDQSIGDLPLNWKRDQPNVKYVGDDAGYQCSPDAGKMSKPVYKAPQTASHPASFKEIWDMVKRGERPPNVRDINDMPPNPNQELSKSLLQPRPKPWEFPQPSMELSNPGPGHQSHANQKNQSYPSSTGPNNSFFEPWRMKKIPEIVSEIEPEGDEYLQFSCGGGQAASRPPLQQERVEPHPSMNFMTGATEVIQSLSSRIHKQLSDVQVVLMGSDNGKVGPGITSQKLAEIQGVPTQVSQ